MSWDVLILNADGTPRSLAEIPEDWQLRTMGDIETARAMINGTLPGVDWTDPAWGHFLGDGYSIEFNYPSAGEVDSFMLHVRGGGDPVSAIVRLCKRNGWAALDTSAGDFMDLDAPSREGWIQFQAFRDRVLGRGSE
jgi:hypothetical protein